jgi:hypothetical protein
MWLHKGKDFILEEDSYLGHDPSQSDPVRTWKENHGLRFFFKCCYTDSGIRVSLSTMAEKASRTAHTMRCNLLGET